MKRVLFFIFFISFFTTKSQTIISDTVLDINCYHEGAIYTKVASLDSNVYTKWYYSQDTSFWNFLDTAFLGVHLNNSNLTSDTLTTTLCGYYKLEIVNVLDTLIEDRIYHIKCKLLGLSEVDIIQCHNGFGTISIDSISGGVSPYSFEWYYNNIIRLDTISFIDSLVEGLYKTVITDSIGCTDTLAATLFNPERLIIDTIIITDVNI